MLLMKTGILRDTSKLALLLAGICAAGTLASSAVPQVNGPAPGASRPPAGSNAQSAALCIPLSVFLIPNSPSEGKDPFFPLSTRRAPAEPIKTNSQPTISFDLQLKGISGPANRRLAIVNNRTLQVGEESDVTTSTGRVRIRCLDIKTESVVVQVGSERRELRLRPGI